MRFVDEHDFRLQVLDSIARVERVVKRQGDAIVLLEHPTFAARRCQHDVSEPGLRRVTAHPELLTSGAKLLAWEQRPQAFMSLPQVEFAERLSDCFEIVERHADVDVLVASGSAPAARAPAATSHQRNGARNNSESSWREWLPAPVQRLELLFVHREQPSTNDG